jgi:hypothetical protein
MLNNRFVLQQHWDTSNKAWAHMVLHLPHAEGGYGVTFNDVTKDAAYYTTTSRFVAWLGAFSQERQRLWLPKDDLQDSSSCSSSPLLLLCDIHCKLLTQYDCKEVCARSQSQVTASLRLPLCGMRALPPMLTLLPSPHNIRLPNRSSATGSPSLTSNLCFQARVALNS